MRVSISGTHSTGKTTLVNLIKKNYNFIFQEGLTRVVNQFFTINSNGGDIMQVIAATDHLKRVSCSDKLIDIFSERCSLDCLAYTQVLYNYNQVSKDVLDYAEYVFKKTINSYDLIFYLKPEFNIVEDGVRDMNVNFRDDVYKCFENIIKSYNINVEILTGSIEQRFSRIQLLLERIL